MRAVVDQGRIAVDDGHRAGRTANPDRRTTRLRRSSLGTGTLIEACCAMFANRTVWLAYNEASGSNDETTQRALDQAFTGAGCHIARRICFPGEPAPTIEQLES
jgi:hypothetical protein